MPAQYPLEFKKRVIKRFEKGESIQTLSQELNVSQSSIYQWRKQYCSIQAGERTYTPKELDAMSKRLHKLEHELEIIRLSGFLTELPLKTKLETLERLHHEDIYSVHELCEALGVTRGTFYNHIFRRVDRSGREAEQAQLMLKVQQIFDDHEQRFGAEKIRMILSDSGVHVSTKRVAAAMQELGLHSIRTDAKKQYKKRRQLEKKDLLKRQFSVDRPNQVWVSDFTYFRINDYWVYFCMIMDLFSRKIVGYQVSRTASTQLITSTFRMAYQKRDYPENLTFHSDRGRQYTSATFTALLEKHNIKQSFSASGRPCDNAVSETFFATFKKEEAYRREYTSEQSFRKSVERYIYFYNEVRPHQTLKYKTPQAFEDAWKASL
ncbi:IS3 family transposase [Intestinimonas butyriciproducens]|uniref:IS3 family transposase n=1 Tax=Intestinimonas butyriciproducens TaxID=1297617 RepID=UPI0026721429|nr:IS3 family transposase [Intestinimonas butyriciproducens]